MLLRIGPRTRRAATATWTWTLVVMVCGVWWRVAFVRAHPPSSLMAGKRDAYVAQAVSIRDTGARGELHQYPDVDFGRGGPFGYGLWLALWSASPPVARLGQALLGGLACGGAVWLGRRLHSLPVGVGMGLAGAWAPPLVQHGELTLPAALLGPLWMALVWSVGAALVTRRAVFSGLAGAAAGAAFLMRAELLPVPLALVAVAGLARPGRRALARHAGAGLLGILLSLGAAGCVPWAVTGSWPPLLPFGMKLGAPGRAPVAAFNMAFRYWEVANPGGNPPVEPYAGERRQRVAERADSPDLATASRDLVAREVRRDPLLPARATLANLLRVTGVPYHRVAPALLRQQGWIHAGVLACLVAWLAGSKLAWPSKLILTLPWWATCALYATVHYEPRYGTVAAWPAFLAAGWIAGAAVQVAGGADWRALHEPPSLRRVRATVAGLVRAYAAHGPALGRGVGAILLATLLLETGTRIFPWYAGRGARAVLDAAPRLARVRTAAALWPESLLSLGPDRPLHTVPVAGLQEGRGYALLGEVTVRQGGALLQIRAEPVQTYPVLRQQIRLPSPGVYACALPADGHGAGTWQVVVRPDGPAYPMEAMLIQLDQPLAAPPIGRWLRRLGDTSTERHPYGIPGGRGACVVDLSRLHLYDTETAPHLPYAHRERAGPPPAAPPAGKP